MKQKLFIGLLIVSIVGVAGAHFYGQTSAQDPPAKTEPAEKKGESDLFDALKKALEGKKEPEKAPHLPPPTNVAPVPDALPLPVAAQEKPVVPAPIALPTLPSLPADERAQPSLPTFNGPGSLNNQTERISTKPSLPPVTQASGTDEKKKVEPAVSLQPAPVPPPSVPQITDVQKAEPKLELPPLAKPDAPPTTNITFPKTLEHVAKLKNCPWKLSVVILDDGRTVLYAIVHKKHTFEIECQNLDLQTGKHTLKATGKVQITGDMLTGSCDSLAIPLMEDRLIMEGTAQVSIQKVSTNVSEDLRASFELKGTSLDLRISELLVAKPVTSNRVETTESPRVLDPVTRANGVAEKQTNVVRAAAWSSYGTLARTKMMVNGQNIWSLEDSQGKLITHLVFREGASMDSYLGRSISVYGPLVTDTSSPTRMQYMRVTHIALP